MIIGNSYELGLWKCGQGKAFKHIPTNFIIFFRINSLKNHLIKRGRKSIALKMFNKNRVMEVFLKKLLILLFKYQGVVNV